MQHIWLAIKSQLIRPEITHNPRLKLLLTQILHQFEFITHYYDNGLYMNFNCTARYTSSDLHSIKCGRSGVHYSF